MVNFVENNYLNKVGTYKVKIDNIELKDTKNGLGKLFEITLKTEKQESYAVRINSENLNDKACEIGYGILLKILRALNQINLIEGCKFLEPKANDYNSLFKMIMAEGVISRMDKEVEFILELYNKKPKEQFDAISGKDIQIMQLGEKFFSIKEFEEKQKEKKVDDTVPF